MKNLAIKLLFRKLQDEKQKMKQFQRLASARNSDCSKTDVGSRDRSPSVKSLTFDGIIKYGNESACISILASSEKSLPIINKKFKS